MERILVALALLAGCAMPTSEDVGAGHDAILAGSKDAVDAAVVAVVFDEGGGFSGLCSGTLIAPNVVLTAHHCVADSNTPDAVTCGETRFGAPHDVDKLFVANATEEPPLPSQAFRAVVEVFVPDENTLCGADVAMLRLAKPLDATPLTPRIDEAAHDGEAYAAVGFGAIDDAGDAYGTRRRRDDLRVACVGASCHDAGVVARELQGGDGTCTGDSGGPALDAEGRVIGVTSRGVGCSASVYGSPASWADFIREGVLTAAKEGGLQAPAWAEDPTPPDPKPDPTPPEDTSDAAGDDGSGCAIAPQPAGGAASVGVLVALALAASRRRSKASAARATGA